MMHDHTDSFSGDSAFSGFDPRAKALGVTGFVALAAFLQDIFLLFMALMFMLCLLALSGIPARHLAGHYGAALPLILFASLSLWLASGVDTAAGMFLRISASVLAVILLVTTTEFYSLLAGLQAMRFPALLTTMLMMTYRFIFVFRDELERMKLARRAKAYRPGRSFLHGNTMRTISNTAGMVLVRAYGRGLRVQDSLRARAYDGRIRTLNRLRVRATDCGFFAVLASMPAFMLCLQWGLVA